MSRLKRNLIASFIVSAGIILSAVVSAPKLSLAFVSSNPHPIPPSNSITSLMLQSGIVSDVNISSTANISDTKLNTVTSTDKVSGTALFNLGSIPAAAGTIPAQNLPPGQLTATATAQTNINIGQPVSAVASGTPGYIASQLLSTTNGSIYNQSCAALETLSQGFTVSATTTINDVRIRASNPGTISNNIILELASGATAPGTTIIASTSIPGSTIGPNIASYYIKDINSVLSPGVQYWINFTSNVRNTGDSGSFVIQMATTTTAFSLPSLVENDGCGFTWASTTAQIVISNFNYSILATPSSASTSSLTNMYIGIAQNSAATGSTVTYLIKGIDNNQHALIVGLPYYISNATGTISETAGSSSLQVGTAIGATSLLLK